MNYFITGATGFVGSHLTETLVRRGQEVTVLLNQTSSLDCFEQTPDNLHPVRIDLLDIRKMTEALSGHDVVIHLAYGSRGTPEEQHRITVEGTRSMLHAATEANVKRFIHMSTASTYGEPPKDKIYTEKDPRLASLDLYPSLKQEAERVVLNTLDQTNTEAVVLQPSIIYGPGQGYWTAGILKTLSQGFFPLVNGGQGLCNLIHVYDVVDAIVLAAMVPDIDGECFILANDNPVPWATFLKSYEKTLGKKCLLNLPMPIMKNYNSWTKYQRKVPEYKIYIKALKVLFKALQFPDYQKPIKIPPNEKIDFFAAKPHFSNRKAKEVLGFSPKITFEEGMRTVEEWVAKNQAYAQNS